MISDSEILFFSSKPTISPLLSIGIFAVRLSRRKHHSFLNSAGKSLSANVGTSWNAIPSAILMDTGLFVIISIILPKAVLAFSYTLSIFSNGKLMEIN